MARLTIRLLGSFQVSSEAIPITKFESNKVRALLAYLAVECDRAHSREKLADMFWPELPAKRAGSNLNQALYNLRGLIGDHQAQPTYLLRGHQVVQFNPESDYWLDVQAFKTLLAEGSFQQLQSAVDLYRGDFLEGVAFDSSLDFDEWVLVVRQRLQRRALGALHQLAGYYAGQGELARALPYAWRQVELDPLGEPAYRQLMELLLESGQRSQALAQFEHLRVLLAQELGVSPEPETLALCDRMRAAGPRPTQVTRRRDNLPAFLTPLVGRQVELAELLEHCEDPDCRLLTVLGPGGSGKTRLALEAAGAGREHFTHGVCFVPLNPRQSADSLLPAVVEALGLPRQDQDNHLVQLTNYLRDKQLLLLLDGFEYLLEGAGMLAELLHRAPGLKLLVTSRTRLNLKGEQLYPLVGMHYPQNDAPETEILGADAVQLLISGLRRARPGYQPAQADLKHLLQVCRQVQGMPLGLLLAASWGASMSLEEIALEVSRGLDFLVADWADLPSRQRSLRATFDHTWELLAEREQAIFRSLSVFRGAFSRGAARVVSGASPHELRALVEKSLLWSNSPGWYEVHELLRQYGRERLARSVELESEVCNRHSAYYLGQLARLGADLKSAQQATALADIDREHENIRAAWNRAAGQGAMDLLAPVVDELCLFYDLAGRYQEGEHACQAALASESWDLTEAGQLILNVHLLIWHSRFTRLLGHLPEARSLRANCQTRLDQAAQVALDVRFEQTLFYFEHAKAIFHRDLAAARTEYRRSLALLQELEQPWWVARVLLNTALCDLQIGDFAAAQASFTAYLDDLSANSDPRHRAYALERLAFLHARRGELDPSMTLVQEAVAVYRSLGDQASCATGLSALGLMLGWHGRYQESVDLLSQCLPIYQDLGDRVHKAFIPVSIGMMLTFLGLYAEAESWLSKGISLGRDFGLRRTIACGQMARGWAALSLGDNSRAYSVLQESVYEYRQVNHQDELGWALAVLAQASLARGEIEAGLEQLQESLQIGLEIGGAMTIRFALGPGALWIGSQGDAVKALELYNLANQNPGIANAAWFADVFGIPIATLASGLSEAVRAAAQERSQRLDLWTAAAELLDDACLRPGPHPLHPPACLTPAAEGTGITD